MFCTPPGVTGLTTCQPPDPCEGYTTDISCVTYTGQDFPCIDVNNGDGLISVLLNILATYFPPEVCCQLEGELSFYTTTTSTTTTSTTTTTTTSTTTTTTSTTTTTTTAAPSTCNCFIFINNDTEMAHTFSYVDCETKVYMDGVVQRKNGGVPGIAYQCGMTGTIRVDDPAFVTFTNTGLCTSECVLPVTTTTTTTSTTVAPTYSRFYEAEVWTCDPCITDPFAPPIVITVADGYPPLVTNNWYRNVDSLDTNIYRVKNSSPGPYSVVVNFWGYTNCADACNPPTPEV
jgi:hypothetical protein